MEKNQMLSGDISLLLVRKSIPMLFGVAVTIILFLMGESIAELFTSDESVIKTVTLYLRIVPLGYELQSLYLMHTGFLNIVQKPMWAASLSIFRLYVLLVPMATELSNRYGVMGIWISMTLSLIITNVAGHILMKRRLVVGDSIL